LRCRNQGRTPQTVHPLVRLRINIHSFQRVARRCSFHLRQGFPSQHRICPRHKVPIDGRARVHVVQRPFHVALIPIASTTELLSHCRFRWHSRLLSTQARICGEEIHRDDLPHERLLLLVQSLPAIALLVDALMCRIHPN